MHHLYQFEHVLLFGAFTFVVGWLVGYAARPR